jgi:hypothetical protein
LILTEEWLEIILCILSPMGLNQCIMSSLRLTLQYWSSILAFCIISVLLKPESQGS